MKQAEVCELKKAIERSYLLANSGSLQRDPTVSSSSCDEWIDKLIDVVDYLDSYDKEELSTKISFIRSKIGEMKPQSV